MCFSARAHDNPTYFRDGDQPRVAQLIDWLIEKQNSGYGMLNSVQRLAEMKQFVRGAHNEPTTCRAGMNTLIIRVDGTLAPCFPMYSSTYDWGVVGSHKFDTDQLREMKVTCEPNCYSTRGIGDQGSGIGDQIPGPRSPIPDPRFDYS